MQNGILYGSMSKNTIVGGTAGIAATSYIEALEVGQFEFVLGLLAHVHESSNARFIIELRLNPVVACQPEAIVSENAWPSNRVINIVHSLQ